jgi:hypothetical protein
MKKLLPIFVLAVLTLFSGSLQAVSKTDYNCVLESDPIHPRDINRLIKIAADEWNWTVGHARQEYNEGELWFVPYPQAGENVYMIGYDGFCILAALEDKL